MIKEENKRFIITFNEYDLKLLNELSIETNTTKSDLLHSAFITFLVDYNNKTLDKKTIIITSLLKKFEHINIKFITNDYIIFSVGLEEHLKVLDLRSIIVEDSTKEDIISQIEYFLLVA